MENPLAELAKVLPFNKMATITELHENTLRNIANMKSEELKGVNLNTYIILKEKLNVDLANNLQYGDIKK